MARISYVNGRYLEHHVAAVHIEDRGYQFADGVYEYIAFYHYTLLDIELHLKRLWRSLHELAISAPMAPESMLLVFQELLRRNSKPDGGLYVQVSRGVARRDHVFPKRTKPSVVMTVCSPKLPKQHDVEQGVRAISQPDIRWLRRDVKSISLLANVLARQAAAENQAREAWLLQGDVVTEGSASNAYIVNDRGVLITHPSDVYILGGVTRDVVLRLAKKAGISIEERGFTLQEAYAAREAFITSTSANVLPVVRLDGRVLGAGTPGAITQQLQALYAEHVFKQTGKRL